MPRRLTIYLADDIGKEEYSRIANGVWCALRAMHPLDSDDFSMNLDRRSAVDDANAQWTSYYAEAGLWGEDAYEEWPPESDGTPTSGSVCTGGG